MDELQKLYDVVTSKGLYTKSFDEFVSKYSDSTNRQKLFDVVSSKGLYTKSFDEFNGKYFGSEPKGVNAEADMDLPSASASGSSSLDSKKLSPEQEKLRKLLHRSDISKYWDKREKELYGGQVRGGTLFLQDTAFVVGKNYRGHDNFQKRRKLSEAIIEKSGVDVKQIEDLMRLGGEQKNKVMALLSNPIIDTDNNTKFSIFNPKGVEDYSEDQINKAAEQFKQRFDSGLTEGLENIDVYDNYTPKEETINKINTIYGDLTKYGINTTDFAKTIEEMDDLSLQQDKFSKWDLTTDENVSLAKEQSKENAVRLYMNKKYEELSNKIAILENRKKQGLSYNEELLKNLHSEIVELPKRHKEFYDNELPLLKKIDEDSWNKESENYYDAILNGKEYSEKRYLSKFGRGLFRPIQDGAVVLADWFGGDLSAEQARLLNQIQRRDDVSTTYGYTGDGYESYKYGRKYIVADDGQIYDTVSKANVTRLLSSEDRQYLIDNKTDKRDSSFSFTGSLAETSEVLGNLATQIVGMKGAGRGLAAANVPKSAIVASATTAGAISYSSTYNDTYDQLVMAGVNRNEAEELANEAGIAQGFVTSATSVFAPNLQAQKALDKRLITNAVNAYRNGGREGFKGMLKNNLNNYLRNSLPETAQEIIQENIELISQKQINAGINEKLGKNVLDTEISKKELFETFVYTGLATSISTLPSSFQHQTKFDIYTQASKDFDKFNKGLNDAVKAGTVSRVDAEKVKKDVLNFTKHSNTVMDEFNGKKLKQEKFFDLVDVLSEVEDINNQINNSDEIYHPQLKERKKQLQSKLDEFYEDKTSTESRPETNNQGTTQEGQINQGKTQNSKKIKSDFDETLWDNSNQQLTPLGQEVKQKIEAGEDVTILTAREDTPENRQFIASKLGISPDRIKLGLDPQGKAAELRKGDIYYDDNKDNLEAASYVDGVDIVDTGRLDLSGTSSELDRVSKLDESVEDGQTFNIDGTTAPKKGLVIPVVSENITQEELTPQRLEEFVQKHKSKIGGNSVKVGVYKFPNSNQVSLDLNIVADTNNRDKAIEFAKNAGQESIFDLETGENIKIGADGSNPKTFTDEEFRGIAKQFDNTINDETAGKQKPAGNRIFNEPLKAVKDIANVYYERAFKGKRPTFKGITKLNKKYAKKIADAFEAMQHNPNDPEVKEAYEAMAKETLEQYQDFKNAGYSVEINNSEPYPNSQEMINDLRDNKRMKIFSTESGFGDDPITEQQRQENPLLRDSGEKDVNGETLLVNDIFRAIHDFYGHAELGNGFGAIGEENAWNVHARMFSPLARRAMTTETRGQNSWVNFSGVNDTAEIQALTDKARQMRKDGAPQEEIDKVVSEKYDLFKFAEQKIGLLPEEFSNIETDEQNQTETKEENEVSGETGTDTSDFGDVQTDESRQKESKEKLNEARENLKSTWNQWLDKKKNQGIIYDPKSEAEADVELTMAFVKYLKALGANTVLEIKLAVKDFTKGQIELDNEQADVIREKVFQDKKRAEKEVKKQTKKSNKATKTIIRENTGQKDLSNKVETTEAKLLKEKYKNLQRGFKTGVKETKALKSDFIKQVKAAIKGLGKNISDTQARSILNKVDKVTSKNIDELLADVDTIVNKIEQAKKKARLKNIKSKVKRFGKSKSKLHPTNLKDLAKGATSIDERYLTNSEINTFEKLLNSINESFQSISKPNYKMVDYDSTMEKLEALNEKAQERRIKELADAMGIDSQGLTNQEILELWKEENADEYADKLTEAKQKEIRNKLTTQAEYSKMGLEGVSTDGMTPNEKKALSALKRANFENMNLEMLKQYIKFVDNVIVNQDFSNVGTIQAKIEADENVDTLLGFMDRNNITPRKINTSHSTAKILGINIPSIVNPAEWVKHIINSMTSLNIALDTIMGGSKNGSKAYLNLGFLGLSNAKVRSEVRKQNFEKYYNNLLTKLKKTYPTITDGEQVVRRSVLATLLQAENNSRESMDYFKDVYLKRSIKTLEQYTNDNQSRNKVEILNNILTELEGINTKEDLVKYLKENDKGNYKLLREASNYFLRHTKEFQDNSYFNHGESFEARTQDDFYLPLSRSNITPKSMREKLDEARNTQDYMSYKSTNPKSGSIFSRKKNARLDKGQTIDFNFDSFIMNKYGEQIYDIEAAQEILKIKATMTHPKVIEKFGSSVIELQQKAIDKIALDSGVVLNSSTQVEKKFAKAERAMRKIGSIIALGGIDQYFKQYPAVVLTAAMRLGVKNSKYLAQYMFTNKADIPLLKQSSIRLRGEADAGIKRVSDDVRYDELSLGEKSKINKLAKVMAKNMGIGIEKARDLTMLSLRLGDVNAANSTFLAYYHSYLADKGIPDSEIDMRTEHTKLETDKVRKDAQAYAQHMVNTTQTSSDLSEGSSLIANPTVAAKFLAGVMIPFSSHANNAMIRFIKASSNLSRGREKKENVREIAATLSEIMAFHSMKAFVLAPATMYLASALYGLGEDDDEELVDWAFQANKAFSGIAGDVLPTPDSFDIDALNFLTYLANRDELSEDEDKPLSFKDYTIMVKEIQRGKKKFYDPEDAPFMFYRYGDQDGFDGLSGTSSNIGLYSIPKDQATKMVEAWDAMLDNELEEYNSYGKKQQFEFDEDYSNFLLWYALKETASTFGMYDAVDRRMMEKRYREIKFASKKKKEK